MTLSKRHSRLLNNTKCKIKESVWGEFKYPENACNRDTRFVLDGEVGLSESVPACAPPGPNASISTSLELSVTPLP